MDTFDNSFKVSKRILLVEDNPDHSLLIKTRLRKIDEKFIVEIVETGFEAIDYLKNNEMDLILSDYELPGINGIEMLLRLRESGNETPCIFLTGQGSEQIVIKALRAGASDYFTKEEGLACYERLVNSICKAINKVYIEKKLAEYRIFLETIIESIPDPVFIKDRSHNWIMLNKAFCDLVGHKKENLLNKSDYDFFPKEEADFFWKKDEEMFKNGKRVEIPEEPITDSEGKLHYLNTIKVPLCDSKNTNAYLIGIIKDITEKKEKEDILRRSEKYYRSLIENSNDIILVLDRNGGIRYISPSVERILGYDPDSSVGKDVFSEFIHEEDKENVYKAFQRKLTDPKKTIPIQLKIKDIKGDYHYFDAVGNNLIEDPAVKGIVINARDITERYKAEEELIRSEERLQAIYKFIPIATYIWRITEDKIILVDYNNAALEITQGKIVDYLGIELKDMYSDIPSIVDDFSRCVKEKIPFKKTMSYIMRTTGQKKFFVISYSFVPPDSVMVFTEDITEYTEAKIALKESEIKYSYLVEQAKDGFVIIQDKKFCFVNSAMNDITGFSVAELTGAPVEILLAEEDKNVIFSGYEGKRKEGEISEAYEIRLKCKNTDIKDIEIRANMIEYGDRKAVMAVLRDISVKRKVEKEIEELKWRMEFILGATRTGLDIIDSDFNIKYIDPEWKKIYGDNEGRKCYEYFMGRDEICQGCGIVTALKTKQITVTEEVLVKENNRIIQVSSMPFQNTNGEWCVAEVNVDITERKRMETEAQKFVSLVENSNDLIAMADFNKKLIYINQAGLDLIGLSNLKEAMEKTVYDFVREGAREHLDNIVFPTVAKIGIWDGEGKIRHFATGRLIDVHVTTFIITDRSKGENLCYATIMRDITEKNLIETTLRAQNKELESFIHAVSHDLKTPLLSIREYSALLLKDFDNQELSDVRHIIERVVVNANKSMDIIKGLQKYTQFTSRRKMFMAFDPALLIKEVITDLGESKDLSGVNIDLQNKWPEIMGDRTLFYQVFVNLIENSFKYGASSIEIGWKREKEFLRIWVKDNGIGIEDDFIERIFDLFARSPRVSNDIDGAGIGLAIVVKAIEKHEGMITVESKLGEGTIFTIMLPIGHWKI